MRNLSDKLKSLGVQIGSSEIPKSPPRPSHIIAEVLGGTYRYTPLGRIFVVDTFLDSGHQQGQHSINISQPLGPISDWIHDPRLIGLPVQALGFLDTETTGLSGGTGTYAFLIGAARFEEDTFHLIQIFMTDPSEEPALLYTLEEFFSTCLATVTFNGKSFDLPLLRSRYAMNGFKDPFQDHIHIDLLHMARRIWRDRLPNRSLGNLEAQILGAQRTEDDVPGWLIPQLYFDFLRDGDSTPLRKVFYHNSMDVVSMAALLNHIAWLLVEIPGNPSISLEEQMAVARLYNDLGHKETAILIYSRLLENDFPALKALPGGIRLDMISKLARICKEMGNYERATMLWSEAASLNDPFACIELAKFYEHSSKNLPEALKWTQTASLVLDDTDLSFMEKANLRLEIEYRKNRLERKRNS